MTIKLKADLILVDQDEHTEGCSGCVFIEDTFLCGCVTKIQPCGGNIYVLHQVNIREKESL